MEQAPKVETKNGRFCVVPKIAKLAKNPYLQKKLKKAKKADVYLGIWYFFLVFTTFHGIMAGTWSGAESHVFCPKIRFFNGAPFFQKNIEGMGISSA